MNEDRTDQLLSCLENLTDIRVQVGVLTTTVSNLVKTQEDLVLAIRGNGKPGLNDRVKDLENKLERERENFEDHKATCPLAAIADDYKADKQSREVEKKGQEQDRKDRDKELRTWKLGLAASIIVLVLSTVANLLVH